MALSMVLLIDNYDSFTFNLAQYLGELGADVRVCRNNTVGIDDIEALAPSHIVISPGPGRPEDAGISVAAIARFAPSVPMLGVCLGHQAMGLAFGGVVTRAPQPVHGKASVVEHDRRGLFAGLATPISVARYHSLIVADERWPPALEVSARTEGDGLVMGLRHREWPMHGVQFHPESVMTAEGRRLLRNFLEM
jgi:anthranilate synthase/aminodeoxychorismate synthase-like glutamine amidotransferase